MLLVPVVKSVLNMETESNGSNQTRQVNRQIMLEATGSDNANI